MEDLNSAGLINFWQSQAIKFEIINEKESLQPRIIGLEQLSGCFQLLFLGFVMSSIAFIIEILSVHFK